MSDRPTWQTARIEAPAKLPARRPGRPGPVCGLSRKAPGCAVSVKTHCCGFTKDDITHFSEDTDLLDDNGVSIVTDVPTILSLNTAIMQAAIDNAENPPNEQAKFINQGTISFSSFFWDRIAAGATIGSAFIYAKSAISYCTPENDISFSCYRPQHPLMDANSNDIANELEDYEIAEALYLGAEWPMPMNRPPRSRISFIIRKEWMT